MTGTTVLYVSAVLCFFAYFLMLYGSPFPPFYALFGLFYHSHLLRNDGTAPLVGFAHFHHSLASS